MPNTVQQTNWVNKSTIFRLPINTKRGAAINGMTIAEFMSTSTTAHEFIRKNTHTDTRNFDQRVKTFIKTIVTNPLAPLNVTDYSYRIEFQMRGKILLFIAMYIHTFKSILFRGAPCSWDPLY